MPELVIASVAASTPFSVTALPVRLTAFSAVTVVPICPPTDIAPVPALTVSAAENSGNSLPIAPSVTSPLPAELSSRLLFKSPRLPVQVCVPEVVIEAPSSAISGAVTSIEVSGARLVPNPPDNTAVPTPVLTVSACEPVAPLRPICAPVCAGPAALLSSVVAEPSVIGLKLVAWPSVSTPLVVAAPKV